MDMLQHKHVSIRSARAVLALALASRVVENHHIPSNPPNRPPHEGLTPPSSMGRLSKRTLQCRAARQQRVLKQQAAALGKQQAPANSSAATASSADSASAGSASGACSAVAAVAAARGAPPVALLRKLGTASLQRYQAAHNVHLVGRAPSREHLVFAIAHHFSTQEVRRQGRCTCAGQGRRRCCVQTGSPAIRNRLRLCCAAASLWAGRTAGHLSSPRPPTASPT